MSKYRASMAVECNQLLLNCIIATRTPPPMASRLIGITHTAMYDAWAFYDSQAVGTRLGAYRKQDPGNFSDDDIEIAVAYAAFRVLKTYFQPALPADKATLIDDWMTSRLFDPTDDSIVPDSPSGLGNLAAQAVLDYRRGDGANTWQTLATGKPYADYTGFRPALGPDDVPKNALEMIRWQPLRVPQADGSQKVQEFLVPHWGQIQPFALRSGAQLRLSSAPEPFSENGRFKTQCEELMHYNANLSDELKMIAEYWADGPNSVTPPGHWCLLAHQVSRRDKHELDRDVKMYFALGNALMDAGIACWYNKRFYNYVRPITAIRRLFKGKTIEAWGGPRQGTVDRQGETWQPYQPLDFVTPPFAEYPSGHSTFSAAAAEILKRFTGSDYFGYGVDLDVGTSAIEPKFTPDYLIHLEWQTFSQAAAQAGMSRRYGGIHFEDGDLFGRELGGQVAEKVWTKCSRLWQGLE